MNHYETLGVTQTAPLEVIEAAWRALSKKYHPDRSKERNAAVMMASINQAHDTLKDPQKRRAYDQWLYAQPHAQTNGHEQRGGGFPDPDSWMNDVPRGGPSAYPSPYGDEVQQEIMRAGERISEKIFAHMIDQLPPEFAEILRRAAMRRGGR
jgi:DnaJ-class molecular chaperone